MPLNRKRAESELPMRQTRTEIPSMVVDAARLDHADLALLASILADIAPAWSVELHDGG
jgi:hypothetical protein